MEERVPLGEPSVALNTLACSSLAEVIVSGGESLCYGYECKTTLSDKHDDERGFTERILGAKEKER